MACSKYTLTNTGSSIANFSYRRCDDNMWEYQVPLDPSETKNIWLIDGSYGTAFANTINKIDLGAFPPVNATATPTPTPTPTPTNTPTPSVNRISFTVYSGSTHDSACGQYNPSTTVYGNNSAFDLSSQFWDVASGDSTIDMSGYIQNGGNVVELDTNGLTVGSVTICTTLTPTPTNTQTPTVTPSQTPSPTPTFGYYTYSLGTGSTPNNACIDFGTAPNTIYGTVAGGIGPNIGEFLYTTPGNPPTNPVADGYYSDGTRVFTVSGGSGEITAVDPSGCP